MNILPLEAPPAGGGNLGPLPPLQAEENNTNQAPAAVATQTRTIGIIHPPPDIRAIVEKTAKHVSINGFLENKIKAENAGKAQFRFLNSSDPYHAFYQHKLAEYRARNQDGAQATTDDHSVGGKDPKPEEASSAAAKPDLHAQFRVPEWITDEDLDIIKLTAQFAARNGPSFLNGLYSRENNNPLFQFMKPTHGMSSLFSALVKAYRDVLSPPEGFKEKLRESAADLTTVMERCLDRLERDRFQEMQRKRDEDERELERVQMAMIDWHDFGVVASLDFDDEEDEALPLPKTREEVIMGSKVSSAMKEVEVGKEVEMEMDEEEVELVAQGMRAANDDSMQIENVNDEGEASMRIVKNWKRPEDRVQTERDLSKVVVSPITGELIPISEMSEHMRISLIDPKFKEQKDRMFAKIRDTTLAQDDEIAKNIVGLARLRPDIFGTTEEEVSSAVKAEIEKKKKDEHPSQVIWDGHTENKTLTQRYNGEEQGHGVYGCPNSFPGPTVRPLPPPPPSVQYHGPPMMQPLHQQHQFFMPGTPGHVPMVMMMNQPPQMHVPPPPGSQFAHLHQVPGPSGQRTPPSVGMVQTPPLPGMHIPPPLPEEPEPKRPKLDEVALVPEDQFLAQHRVPANKQKLSGKAGFLKENMSLAHYNVEAGEILTLSLRERGGRKR